MKQKIEILIVSRSVVLQQGLSALLESMPEVANLKAVKDLPGAYVWIEERQPHVILLDEDTLGKNKKTALEKIRTLAPNTQRVLLANDIQQANLLLTCAEAILIKGTQPSAIASTIKNLLPTKGDENEPHNDSN